MRHFGPISGIATFKDTYVATAGYDNQVILWDARTRTPIQRVLHDHLANQCAFNAAGTLLVSASSDYTARVWEVPSLRLKTVLIGHDDDIEMAAFSPDGQTIATCSRDHSIRLFNLSGQTLRILHGHTADVISVCWSADGQTLVSSSDDGSIRRWDANTGQQLETIDLGGVETDTVALSREGIIFAGDDEGKISIISPRGTLLQPAHSAGIKRIIWDDSQRLLISLSYDRSVMLWHLKQDGTLVKTAETSLPSIIWPRSCALLGSHRIAFVTFGSRYATWDFATQTWDLSGIEPAVSLNAVAVVGEDVYSIGDAGILHINGQPSIKAGSLCNFLLPFGDSVLTGGQMGTVFDARTGATLYQHRSPLNCGTTFIKDGALHAAIGTYTGEALIFCLDQQQPRFVTQVRMHENAIKGIAADETYIFSVCATAAAAFFRIADFGLETYLDKAHERISNGCTQIQGGFASIGRDLKLRLWRDGASEVFDTPHSHSIKCIAISRDRSMIATGSYGGTVAVFDLKKRVWASVEKPTASGISCLIHDASGEGFLASAYDGRIYPITPPGRCPVGAPMTYFSEVDFQHMQHALSLAERGSHSTWPNPRVGCVIAHGSQVVGEGWHRRAGGPHAEVFALRQAGGLARGATAYVTMEPCSHVGRTGACHQALIDSGVHSVVVAHQDPFEQVNGQGIAQLRNAGIEVRVGLLESAAQELNRGFLSTVRRQRPWVQLKMGMSLDGRTALDNGRSKWITSTRARADVQYWRARSSAILTGSGTVLADDPLLTVRQLSSPEALAPVRVVLDSQGRVPATARVFNDQAPSLHVVHRECPLASSDSEQVMALPGDDQGLHLEQLLHNLSQRGLHDLLVEAGPTLAGNLLKAHLVDELLLYVAPRLLGDLARPLVHLPCFDRLEEALDFALYDVSQLGPDLRLRLRPAQPPSAL